MQVSLRQAKGLFKQLSKTFSQCTKNKLPNGYTYNPTGCSYNKVKVMPNGNIKTNNISVSNNGTNLSFETLVTTPNGQFVSHSAGTRVLTPRGSYTETFGHHDQFGCSLDEIGGYQSYYIGNLI